MIEALVTDYRQAPVSDADRAMLDFVVQLTKDASQIKSDDHRKLREVGFDEVAILQMTLIASWFNYINRMADGLGVGKGPASA